MDSPIIVSDGKQYSPTKLMMMINIDKDTIFDAQKVFELEIAALQRTQKRIDDQFCQAVSLCAEGSGKVILTGMGKSGLIAQKIAATLASTGTLAVYLHPAEGLHGDLGIIQKNDIVIAISKDGLSESVLSMIPAVKRMGAKLVAFVGDITSALARNADVVIDISVTREACHLNLAPTCSTTTALVMGDALSVVLSKMKNFKQDDFALFHPGGVLGKRLILKVTDLMHRGEENPVIHEDDTFDQVLLEMSRGRMGVVTVVGPKDILVGIITDGDLRRLLQKYKDKLMTKRARDIMTKDPIVVQPNMYAYDALKLMEARKSQIKELPVVDTQQKAVGIISLHDLVQAGL